MTTTPLGHNDAQAPLPEIRGFKLIRLINRGGMSSVYLGEQVTLGRQVAIKVMEPHALADETSRRRFENEVRTIARLEHPHVVRIHDVGRTATGLPYYTMPHLARGHLGRRSFAGNEAGVIATLRALLSALDYAHSRGVVHRDVKAENVLFDEADRPLLADFGIALRRGFGARVTSAGLAVGSTAYMAPEQARGEDVDGRADLYSLGVLAWEMLTGLLPYRAADALSMAVMHAQDPIPKLPTALRHWQRFMNRALAKAPTDRFANVAEMSGALDDIERHRGWPLLASLGDRAARLGRSLRGRRAALAGFAAVVLIGTAYAMLAGADRPQLRTPGTPVEPATLSQADAVAPMLRPLPEAPLQAALEDARRQLGERKLLRPVGENARASVVTAWRLDPSSVQVREVLDAVTSALGDAAAAAVRTGNDAQARDYMTGARQLGEQTGTATSKAQLAVMDQTAKAIDARMRAAEARLDQAAARATADLARDVGLPAARISSLVARAKALPGKGQKVPGDPAGSVVGKGRTALARTPVTVGDYQSFARETGRKEALCRERASLLRVVKPRTWREPGFSQGDRDPVVCVSLTDAEAYARWRSEQSGHRYRLPTADEARALEARTGDRPIALWSADCGSSCSRRVVSGASWRNKQDSRTLGAERGYDDVGFRLLREL
ncbi:bifunctional serine/threonine-protein kinase/formylglycine-generating enzyme family protein [Aerolutibacter ruishenii]|uniref:Serine/threonine protein kinase n=1 Tax=Aerolutibacter ruishenii TaxID=686800 RepID=A0A562LSP6_9GAMM|nr:bifunctional serine/threonine-protein kinase/formylglycine-generating enzyme family protein [Lysobacter ruishenii]TWI10626.1 serine/threonine protein kinase [Lysobacter ruishenii]